MKSLVYDEINYVLYSYRAFAGIHCLNQVVVTHSQHWVIAPTQSRRFGQVCIRCTYPRHRDLAVNCRSNASYPDSDRKKWIIYYRQRWFSSAHTMKSQGRVYMGLSRSTRPKKPILLQLLLQRKLYNQLINISILLRTDLMNDFLNLFNESKCECRHGGSSQVLGVTGHSYLPRLYLDVQRPTLNSVNSS
jgi:hypothetical protein